MRGIKVSKPGISTDSEDPRDFTIHSQYNIFKIAQEGTGDFVGGSVDIEHDLGYKPTVWLYGYHPELERWFSAPTRATGAEWTISWGLKHISDNVVRLEVAIYAEEFAPSPLEDMYYKYYIMIEPRQDAWYD